MREPGAGQQELGPLRFGPQSRGRMPIRLKYMAAQLPIKNVSYLIVPASKCIYSGPQQTQESPKTVITRERPCLGPTH